MLKVLAVSGVFASLLAAPTAAQAAPTSPMDHVSIAVVSVNGSGCPNGTATATVADDDTSFTVSTTGFFARGGEGALPGDFRKNCQVSLRVGVPEGFTYAISGAEYWGVADLPDGASATEQTSYYFQGMGATARMRSDLSGPMSKVWRVQHSLGPESMVFAPCNSQHNLNVNTEVRVGRTEPDTTSIITRGVPNLGADTTYRLAWKPCH